MAETTPPASRDLSRSPPVLRRSRRIPWQQARIFDTDRELAPTRRAPIELPLVGERGGIVDIANELVHEQQQTRNKIRATTDKKLIYLEWNDAEATALDNWGLPTHSKGTKWGHPEDDQFIGEDAVQRWQSLTDVRSGVEKFTIARQKERMGPEPENEYIGIPLMFNSTDEAMATIKMEKQIRDPFYKTDILSHRQDYQPRVPKCDRHLPPQLLIKNDEDETSSIDGEGDHLFHSSALTGPKLPLHFYQAHKEQLSQFAAEYRRDNPEATESAGEGDVDPLDIFHQAALEEDESLYDFEPLPIRPPSFLDMGEHGQSRFYPRERISSYGSPQPTGPLKYGRGRKRKSTCAPRQVSKRTYKWKDGVAPQRRLGHVKYPKGHIYHNLPKRGEFVIPMGNEAKGDNGGEQQEQYQESSSGIFDEDDDTVMDEDDD